MLLHDFFDYQAREIEHSDFAIQGERHLTYGEALDEVHRLANAFISVGLKKGDRVGVLSKSSIEYAVLYFAASKAGVVLVPLNYRLAPSQWSYILSNSEAKLLIAANEYVTAVENIRKDLSIERGLVSIGTEKLPGWQNYSEWTASEEATPPDRVISEQDDVYQMYTSGTTGHPKGAVITHYAVTSNLMQLLPLIRLEAGERFLAVAPMYHAAGAIVVFCCVFQGTCLYIQEDFDPVEVVRALSQESIVGAFLVPAMIQACLVSVPDLAQFRYPHLRFITYGASPISEETLRQAFEAFQCGFFQGYGMTETTVAISFLLPRDHQQGLSDKPELLLSAGRPLAGTEVRIVDADDKSLPAGRTGEIVVRGPQLMRGYWKLPAESKEVLRGGWMHTGDAGKMDEEGYIYILDRVKDMIVSGGENVYPRAVEDVLFGHSDVADVAVIGVPDEQWGETVKAIVVLREGSEATQEELIEFCRGKLGGFEQPRSVDFVDELPRNPSGKVLKQELREPYWKGQERRVAGS